MILWINLHPGNSVNKIGNNSNKTKNTGKSKPDDRMSQYYLTRLSWVQSSL
jgi:hypothetical protein